MAVPFVNDASMGVIVDTLFIAATIDFVMVGTISDETIVCTWPSKNDFE
jgi:hypothetical protein